MLAIDGGEKVRSEPFPTRHLFGEEERDAALALFDVAVKTGHAIGYNGAEEQAYEQAFADFLGGGSVRSGFNFVRNKIKKQSLL